MYKLKIIFSFYIIFILSSSLFAQSTLDSLISRALEVSPMLKMLKAKEDANKSRASSSSNLPNPMLSFGLMSLPVNSFSFNKEPMTAKVLGLSQEFPFPGKLSAVEKAGLKDAEITQQEILDQVNQIKKEITKNFYELNYIRKEIELTQESQKLIKDILSVVQSMYAVSLANQQNIFRLNLELTKIAEMISMLKSEERELLSSINSYLLQDPLTSIETGDFPELKYIDYNVDDLISRSKSNRPLLKEILLAEEKEKLNQAVSEYEYYPMFKISGQYAFRGTLQRTTSPLDDMISVMIDVSLPLNYGGKVSSMVDESKSMQDMFKAQYYSAIQTLSREFGSINAKLASLKERIELVEEGSMIQAKENFNSALAAYQVGNIDFMNVIEAQDNLYTISKNLYRLQIDYLNQVAELEFLTGIKLNEKANGDK